jgi:hypothetical protein
MERRELRILAGHCITQAASCSDLRVKQTFREVAEELAHRANELDGINTGVLVIEIDPPVTSLLKSDKKSSDLDAGPGV